MTSVLHYRDPIAYRSDFMSNSNYQSPHMMEHSKKEMSYEQLKAATIDAVKSHFVPTVDSIKKRVDSLVESDYLKRSEEDRNFFHYVA